MEMKKSCEMCGNKFTVKNKPSSEMNFCSGKCYQNKMDELNK